MESGTQRPRSLCTVYLNGDSHTDGEGLGTASQDGIGRVRWVPGRVRGRVSSMRSLSTVYFVSGLFYFLLRTTVKGESHRIPPTFVSDGTLSSGLW